MPIAILLLALASACAAAEPTHLELRLADRVLLWPLSEVGTLHKTTTSLRIRDTAYAFAGIRSVVFRTLAVGTVPGPSLPVPASRGLAVLDHRGLHFRLPAAGRAKIWVSDLRGRPLRLLWEGRVPAGPFQVAPEALPLPPGRGYPGPVLMEREGALQAIPAPSRRAGR